MTLFVAMLQRSMRPSKTRVKRPSQGKRLKRLPAGSAQTDDSMGSSVKLTNSEIITATTTVRMPNWKKNRPMMPPMNATGANTGHDREGGGQHGKADSSVAPKAAS